MSNHISEETHPIDIVEEIAQNNDWDFDRLGEDQIAMAIAGRWGTYSVSLSWSPHDETLRLICTFRFVPVKSRLTAIAVAINLANEQCWTGNFILWEKQKLMAYRYGLTLAGEAVATGGQVEAMTDAAIEACERFYPAFQLVNSDKKKPAVAMQVAMTAAYGRA